MGLRVIEKTNDLRSSSIVYYSSLLISVRPSASYVERLGRVGILPLSIAYSARDAFTRVAPLRRT